MPKKNIVICSDGTGNSAVKGRGTNVFKLFESIDAVGHHANPPRCPQVAIYDDGVGTQSMKLIRALAGAFGFGLARNVRQLYTELARVYEPGDDIYMFGFSRGAFTVRTLAGFVDYKGIVDRRLSKGDLGAAVGDLYREYRKKKPAVLERITTPLSTGLRKLGRGFARLFTRSEKIKPVFHRQKTIKFVGVWDTVDAVGFPVPGIAGFWNHGIHRFKFDDNKALPDCVDRACHALAIDEERASFALTLWDHDPGRTEQVWFAGVHSNIGGGYPKQGMSLVTLDWMMDHAEAASGGDLCIGPGLRKRYREGSNVFDTLYDSRSGAGIYYRYRPRDIGALCKKQGIPVRIHHTAMTRIGSQTRGYAPGNLPDSFAVVGPPGTPDRDVTLEVETAKGPKKPKFSGANGFWKKWRQSVQIAFYVAQAALLWPVITGEKVTHEMIPEAPELVIPAEASNTERLRIWATESLSPERLVPWSMQVAGNLVAPIPGEFMQEKVVWPLFKEWKRGLAFVALFPVCFVLGMVGRLRQEAIDSKQWRGLEVV